MNQAEIGKFIAACRKEKKLTQAQLAEKLNLTDRAVSKWETGKSMPDASVMLELCGILGITVNELLSGEKIDGDGYEKKADENLIALKRKDEKNRTGHVLVSVLFSAALLAGMMVCFICDLARAGRLTWSRVPAASLLFAWAVFFPGIFLGKKGLTASCLALSVFILPYLFLLGRILRVKEVFSIGAPMAAVSVAFLWFLAAVFRRMKGKPAAWGTAFLTAVPFMLLVNAILAKMTGEPVLDVWDMAAVLTLLALALACFALHHAKKTGWRK